MNNKPAVTIPANAAALLRKARRYDRMAADAAKAAKAAKQEEADALRAADVAEAAVLEAAGYQPRHSVYALRKFRPSALEAVPADLLEAYHAANAAFEEIANRADAKRLGYEVEGYRYGAAALRKAAVSAAIAANAGILQAAPCHYKKTEDALNAVVEALGVEGVPTRDGGRTYAGIYGGGYGWGRWVDVVIYDGARRVKIDWIRRDESTGRLDIDNSALPDAGDVPTPAQVRKAARLALEAPAKKRKASEAYGAAVRKITNPLWMLASVREDLQRIN